MWEGFAFLSQWLEKDFEEIYLRRFFEYGFNCIFCMEQNRFPRNFLYACVSVRTFWHRWGRDRYVRFLALKNLLLLAAFNLQKEEHPLEQKEKYAEHLRTFATFCREFLIYPDISEKNFLYLIFAKHTNLS